MVEPNPRGQPILLEDPYTFNDLAFDTILERLLRTIRILGYRIELLENFDFNRVENGVRLLQRRVNLRLVCPLCANIRNTEEGVAKMFYTADRRENTWLF